MLKKTKNPSKKTLKDIQDNGVALTKMIDKEIKKDKSSNPLEGLNGQLMISAAHRYCLGRQSYIVSSGIEWLTQWWSHCERNTKRCIVRDTIHAIQDDTAGSKYDLADWLVFAEWSYDTLELDDKEWCKASLVYNNKPWPLQNNT